MSALIQETLFGGRRGVLHAELATRWPADEPDARKRWLMAHAGQEVTILHQHGMQLRVQAKTDDTIQVALTTELDESAL